MLLATGPDPILWATREGRATRGGSAVRRRSWSGRLWAITLAGALAAPWQALPAVEPPAALDGVIRSVDRAPIEHARLLALDLASGAVHRSAPTNAEGQFALADLTPGTYELAVETDRGLYLVASSIELVPGVKRSVQVALAAPESESASAAEAAPHPVAGVWNNPFTAGLIVLGFAIVVGVLVKNATEDEPAASP